jgi:5'-nucleotidase
MDFLSGGGDGYQMFKGARQLISPEQAQSDFDILRQIIMTARTIAPKIDGRIKRLDSAVRQKSVCAPGA